MHGEKIFAGSRKFSPVLFCIAGDSPRCVSRRAFIHQRISKESRHDRPPQFPEAVRFVFELTTLDFGYGFSVPDLDFRTEFVPDETMIVRLPPQKTGKFEYLCDNFCGGAHEEIDGHLVVEE